MNIQIQVIKVSKPETKSGNGRSYNTLEVTYKDLTSGGKVGGKKLVDFGDYAHVYKAAKDWAEDQVVSLQIEKINGRDGKPYWTWVSVISDDTEILPNPSLEKETKVVATKQQWVPDEVRQRLIVRQSALERAINFEANNNPTIEDVLKTAERFVDWVFEVPDGTDVVQEPAKRGRKPKVVEAEVD